ncbi:MAG: GtrA family protein, partial [Bacilli bacterium]
RRAGILQIAKGGLQFLRLCATHDAMVAEAARVIRFTLVGGLNTTVDLSIFVLLMTIAPPGRNGLQASAFAVVGWGVASLVGYFLHTRFTFRRRIHTVGFYMFSLLGVLIQAVCVGLATEFLGTVGALAGKLLGILLASGLTYMGFRWLVHRASSNSDMKNTDVENVHYGYEAREKY